MYAAIHIVVSYEFVCMYYPLLSSLDVPVDMVHPLQSKYRQCAGLGTLFMISIYVLASIQGILTG